MSGRCARCGTPINENISAWTPTMPGELCGHCAGTDQPWAELHIVRRAQRMPLWKVLLVSAPGVVVAIGLGGLMYSSTHDPVLLAITFVIALVAPLVVWLTSPAS